MIWHQTWGSKEDSRKDVPNWWVMWWRCGALLAIQMQTWSDNQNEIKQGWNQFVERNGQATCLIGLWAKLWLNYVYIMYIYNIICIYIYIDKLPSIGFQSPILTCCFRIDHWTVVIRSRGIHRRKTRVCMGRISRGTWRIWMLQSRTHSKALQLIELGSSLIDSSWHTHIIYIYNYIWLYIYT